MGELSFEPQASHAILPKDCLALLVRGQTLKQEQAQGLFEHVLQGALEPAQVGALLALLAQRSPTIEELTGAARAMRSHVTPVPIDRDWLERGSIALLDTCGTGGAAKTFNVSTLAAILAAAAAPGRVVVAKHGNRSKTGRGSAEVLKGLGVNVDASPQVQARCLRECGVCFCFAIHHHPAMRHAGPVRQTLGFPTIFNVLGPLTNPAGADCQLLGVYDEALRPRVASALAGLRCRSAWVVRSEDGLDELSINAPTRVSVVRRVGQATSVSETIVEPGAGGGSGGSGGGLGLRGAPMAALAAEDLGDAVRIAKALFAGEGGPRRDMLVLNAACALMVANACGSLEEGMAMAGRALETGAALRTLDALARISHEAL